MSTRRSATRSAKEMSEAILKIETLLEVLEEKIEKEQSLSRDLNILVTQKEIIEKSQFSGHPVLIKFIKLLDSIETLKRENDTDTKALLVKVKQVEEYIERNK